VFTPFDKSYKLNRKAGIIQHRVRSILYCDVDKIVEENLLNNSNATEW
jgi:hypothetical protein